MAINPEDLKILRSERISDESDGGGQMTNEEINPGEVNNLWSDISLTLQIGGGVSIRKLYGAIASANRDQLLGAGFFISRDASAENVSTLLFDTDDHYDERAAARDKIESYRVKSTRSPLRPVGTQREGQRSIIVYSDSSSDAPEIGAVLFLVNNNTGDEQAIQVTDVTGQYQDYYYEQNNEYKKYRAWEHTITISQALQYEFEGRDPEPVVTHPTEIFKSQTSDGQNYYGIKPLQAAATAGDQSVKVDGIFQSIIPALTSETALVDQSVGVVRRAYPSAGDQVTRSLGTRSGAQDITLPTWWARGTLILIVAGGEYEEDGDTMVHTSGADYVTDIELDPINKRLVFTVSGSRSVSVKYEPSSALELTPYTDKVTVGEGNRQATYTFQLYPAPLPGTVRVEFMYLGDWYTLDDNGTGDLTGDATGTINYSTGSGSISLPAEPDLGSAIIYTWAQSPYYTGDLGSRDIAFEIPVAGSPVQGTMEVAWSRSGTNYTATANSSDVLSNGAGDVADGHVIFTPANLPDTDITLTYTNHNDAFITHNASISQQTGGQLVINLPDTDIQRGSVGFNLDLTYTSETLSDGTVTTTRFTKGYRIYSTGSGSVAYQVAGSRSGGHVCGSLDAPAGTITLDCDEFTVVAVDYTKSSGVLGGWEKNVVVKTMRVETQTAAIRYMSTSAGTEVSETISLSQLELKIPLQDDFVLPGATFSINGYELVTDTSGNVLRGWDVDTGAGVTVGNLDVAAGCAIVSYNDIRTYISSLTTSVTALLAGVGAGAAVDSVVFRTAASPLRPSGMQFQARRASDGALMLAESDNAGDISGTFQSDDRDDALPQPGTSIYGGSYQMTILQPTYTSGDAGGTVESDIGLVEIIFDDPVLLATLTYNAVAYKTIPQDPDKLGVDPVKLPSDGRVPIYKDGYKLQIHNTQDISVASPVAGQVINCGRTDLTHVFVTGDNGHYLAFDQYTTDLAAGTVTLADPLTLVDTDGTSLPTPLTVAHRISQRVVCTQAGIDGTLQLNLQLTQDYPADTSYVSGFVDLGDIGSRVYNLFDQKVDEAGLFKDTLVGDPASATYDDLNYPILVSNYGAVEDRWKLKFTGSESFECHSEQRGLIGTGNINADFSPINPMNGQPYLTIYAAGFGAGWVNSNIIRFNTGAAAAPIWAIRSVTPSNTPVADDEVYIELTGSAD